MRRSRYICTHNRISTASDNRRNFHPIIVMHGMCPCLVLGCDPSTMLTSWLMIISRTIYTLVLHPAILFPHLPNQLHSIAIFVFSHHRSYSEERYFQRALPLLTQVGHRHQLFLMAITTTRYQHLHCIVMAQVLAPQGDSSFSLTTKTTEPASRQS